MDHAHLLSSHLQVLEMLPAGRLQQDRGLGFTEQAILETVPEALVCADEEGNIVYANGGMENTFGCSPNDALGMQVMELVADRFRGHFARMFFQFVKARPWAPLCFESRGRRGNGEEFPMEVRLGLVKKGREVFVLNIIRDLTDMEILRKQLRRSQELEAVALLARGVAHDFNNVLTVINGYSELLLKDRQFDDDTRSMIKEMFLASKHATELVRQLLTFRERKPTITSTLDLNEIVSGTVNFLSGLLGKNVSVVTRLSPEPIYVRTNSVQMERVIINLAINARDAMNGNGQIVMETGHVSKAPTAIEPEMPPGEYAMLAITDNGCGMDEETKIRIFEPLFTTKAPGQGTGLGLATVADIVREFGGHIEVTSEPGQGTTFTLFMPRTNHPGFQACASSA